MHHLGETLYISIEIQTAFYTHNFNSNYDTLYKMLIWYIFLISLLFCKKHANKFHTNITIKLPKRFHLAFVL